MMCSETEVNTFLSLCVSHNLYSTENVEGFSKSRMRLFILFLFIIFIDLFMFLNKKPTNVISSPINVQYIYNHFFKV